MNNTYVIEKHKDLWRVIEFEYPHDDIGRSVKNIFEADNLNNLAPYIPNYSQIERIVCEPHDILPPALQYLKQTIDAKARLQYIMDCHQAVIDAREDLRSRKAELAAAIEETDVYNLS